MFDRSVIDSIVMSSLLQNYFLHKKSSVSVSSLHENFSMLGSGGFWSIFDYPGSYSVSSYCVVCHISDSLTSNWL